MSANANTDPNAEGVFDLDVDQPTIDAQDAIREAVESVEAIERGASMRREQVGDAGDAAEEPRGRGTGAGARDDVLALQAEVADYRERYLRALADCENLRKRAERERDEQRRRAGRDILRALLDVVDNFERARTATGSLEDLNRGVDMIHRQLLEVLRRFGVEPYDSKDQTFDPERHEAVASVEAEVEAPTVRSEFQRGYTLGGAVLRPAIVQVAVPGGAPGSVAAEEAGG